MSIGLSGVKLASGCLFGMVEDNGAATPEFVVVFAVAGRILLAFIDLGDKFLGFAVVWGLWGMSRGWVLVEVVGRGQRLVLREEGGKVVLLGAAR
jgi:hypothetical protein